MSLLADSEKFRADTEQEGNRLATQVAKEVPFDQHFKWYHDSYTAQVPKLKQKTNYEDGMLKRISNISTMKYAIRQNMLFGNTVVFKLYDVVNRKETNYATLFCENIEETDKAHMDKNIHMSQIIGNIIMKYYSVSPSLISCDGEYRSKFNKYQSFIGAKMKMPEVWNEIDAYVTKISSRRQWTVYASYFHGRESDSNYELERIIKSNLIAQNFLALAWFHTIYMEYLGLSESHMNVTFKEIFMAHLKVDTEFIKDLIKKHTEEQVEDFRIVTSQIVHPVFGSNRIRYVPLGYKMIPLNMREVQHPIKLKYKPWREYLVGNKCNDLVINQIAPGFPIALDWFLIKKTHKGLFDNKSQYERLKHSELAKSILSLLYDAQRSTYFATSDFGQNKKSTEQVKNWISSKFKRLSDRIREPIDFSIEEIIMSDVTLAYPSEFVGRTFADTINLLSISKTYAAKIGNPLVDYDIFAKYMFEVCYNLLALNKRLGVIHGDFHLNNATIGFLYKPSVSDARVVYEIDDQHKFIFDNNGYFSCIIDFSRAIVRPDTYDVLQDLSLPDNMKIIGDYDKFAAGEVNSMINLYTMLFPNKQKQKEELTVVFKNNLEAAFKLMTCVDIYMFAMRLNNLLKNLNKKFHDLLDKIIKLAEGYLATEMNYLIKDESYGKKILADEYPLATIMKKCFGEYVDGSTFKKEGVVIDYYLLNNPMDKSISKYELFPDVLKYSRYYDKKGKEVDVDIINNLRKEMRGTYEESRMHNFEHLKFLAKKYADFEELD